MPESYTRRLERGKEYVSEFETSPENKKLILGFIDQLSAEGLTQIRQIKYLYAFSTITKLIKKDFPQLTKQDVITFCAAINSREYTEWTKRDFKIIMKRFMRWVREQEGQEFDKHQYPAEVKWISTSMKNNRKKLPSELLTIDDVKRLAEATNNLRDRCFVLVMYESGARIGELMNIKLKDVEAGKYGTKVTLSGKTGERKIQLIASAPSISNWLLDHPDRENGEAPLFCGLWSKKRGMEVEYDTFRYMLQDLADRSGVKKPVNPHNFRHSRATELSKSFTEAQLCQYMGWIVGSREAATYVHLSGRDMDKAILKLNGIVDDDEAKESEFSAVTCPRCGIVNTPEAKFCSHCSLGLDVKAVMEYEKTSKETLQIIDDPKQSPAILQALIEKVELLERELRENRLKGRKG